MRIRNVAAIVSGMDEEYPYHIIRGINKFAKDNYISLRSTGNACEKDSLAAELLLEIFSAFLNGKTACDLGHRSEAGK